jgi:hypothetical protein
MDDLMRYLGGGELSGGELALAWAVGLAAGVGVAALLLLALV